MSKIDETQEAIGAAKDKVDEAIAAINAAAQEAEGAQDGLAGAGADGSAQLLGQCTLEQAVQALSGVNDTLDEASQQAEAGKG